jgi:death-on-curing protein
VTGTRYLTLDVLMHIARRTLGGVEVRDVGLLEAALARPQSTVFGQDAYPTLLLKAAAQTHSLAKNHALVDGNKRLSLAALIALVGINGFLLDFSNDQAHDFIYDIASGARDGVHDIAERLRVTPIG